MHALSITTQCPSTLQVCGACVKRGPSVRMKSQSDTRMRERDLEEPGGAEKADALTEASDVQELLLGLNSLEETQSRLPGSNSPQFR